MRKEPLERPRRKWEDNIKLDPREVGWGRGMDRNGLAQDSDRWRAVVNAVMNLLFLYLILVPHSILQV
jgi:hypothetical protein